MRILGLLILICLLVAGLATLKHQTTPPLSREAQAAKDEADRKFTAAVYAVNTLKKAMKNPDSFKLEQAVRMPSGALCLAYRATNSFNAIVPARAVIAHGQIITSDDRRGFNDRWKAECEGKTGEDLSHISYALRMISN